MHQESDTKINSVVPYFILVPLPLDCLSDYINFQDCLLYPSSQRGLGMSYFRPLYTGWAQNVSLLTPLHRVGPECYTCHMVDL